MTKDNDKPQLHISMLETYSRCGIQFQRRYGARFGCWPKEEIVPPSIALVVGRAVHSTIQWDMTKFIETGQHRSNEERRYLATSAVGDLISDEGLHIVSKEDEMDLPKTIANAKALTARLVAAYYSEVGSRVYPVAVEEKFVLTMKNEPIDLAGQMDIREPNRIRDTKTRSQSPRADAARSMQMTTYSLAHLKLYKSLPDEVCVDVAVKGKSVKVITVTAKPEMSWMNPVMRRIEQFIHLIELAKEGKDCFTPADPNSDVCRAKYCGYYSTCPFWSGRM